MSNEKVSPEKPRLLVVEDDIHLLEGVQSVLEIEGYTISTAENGAVALQKLCDEQFLPDLIISDIMMPYMDGLQFLREVRSNPRLVSIPFIFLTARGEKSDIHTGKRLGVDDYIIKPFDTDDLLIAIESRLQRQKALNDITKTTISGIKRNILNVLNHEFRTPLTYIVAYADMLNQSDAGDMQGDDLLTFLHGVNSGALRLRRLVENFIQLVEMETGEAERTFAMRKTPIEDVEHLFHDAIDALRTNVPDRPLGTIEFQVPANLPKFVGDSEFLRIALMHLIDNAIKFSNRDQVVTVSAFASDTEIMLSVHDDGRGIKPDEVEKIWDMFYQVNRAYYEDQGVGAGLPIVRGIVRLHNGRVTLESEIDKGSTFTIHLPLTKTT